MDIYDSLEGREQSAVLLRIADLAYKNRIPMPSRENAEQFARENPDVVATFVDELRASDDSSTTTTSGSNCLFLFVALGTLASGAGYGLVELIRFIF